MSDDVVERGRAMVRQITGPAGECIAQLADEVERLRASLDDAAAAVQEQARLGLEMAARCDDLERRVDRATKALLGSVLGIGGRRALDLLTEPDCQHA